MEAEKDNQNPKPEPDHHLHSLEQENDVKDKISTPSETPKEAEALETKDVGSDNNDSKKKEEGEASESKVGQGTEEGAEPKIEEGGEIKIEEGDEHHKIEESPPPDFEQASEEIERFISTLSSFVVVKDGDDQTHELPDVPEVFEHFSFLVEANIANYDPAKLSNHHPDHDNEESKSFFKSVDLVLKLTKSLCEYNLEPKYALTINRIGGILHRAMCYLEEEFRHILEDPKFVHNLDHKEDEAPIPILEEEPKSSEDQKPQDQEPKSSGENSFPGYSTEAISRLNVIVKAMAKAGYEAECYQVYIISRRTILEDTLHRLGYEKLSIDEIQKMAWEPLEGEIMSWRKTYKEFLSVQFSSERKLSEAIFSDDKALSDSLFTTITLSMTTQLLNFAGAVAITKLSSQKLFKFIDIYETLRDTIKTMDNLLPEESANDLKAEASLISTKLGEAIVAIFSELAISIKADMGKNNVPGGAVHPLTRYTLNYLKYACEYKDTLEQIFKEHQKNDHDQHNSNENTSNNNNNSQFQQSPFGQEINKVMELLDSNLDSKSKLYKDNALSSIFMMNNGRYILQKIKGSPEINSLMGDTWSRKRSSELRNYHKTYQRETWNRLLNCLSPEGLTVNGKVQKPVLKEKFKSFNAMFDEIHKTQSMWVVSDEQLQSELRVSISAVVIPAYRSFLARYGQTFTPGRQVEKYIKYQAEDIETHIDELFDGNSTPTGRRRL